MRSTVSAFGASPVCEGPRCRRLSELPYIKPRATRTPRSGLHGLLCTVPTVDASARLDAPRLLGKVLLNGEKAPCFPVAESVQNGNTMKTLTDHARQAALAMLLLAVASAASAQNIYKCSKAGKVQYSDVPCVGQPSALIHQASDSEMIDQYLELGKDDDAKNYAASHDVLPLYEQEIGLRDRYIKLQTEQQAKDAIGQKKAAAAEQRQAIADAAADRARVQGESDAFLQQNAAQINALSHPVNNDTGASYNPGPQYHYGDAPSDRGQNHDYGTTGGRGTRGTGVNQTAPLVLHAPRYDNDHDHDHGSRAKAEPPPTATYTLEH